MKIHKEGHVFLIALLLILGGINFALLNFTALSSTGCAVAIVCSSILYLFFLQFFRSPKKVIEINDKHIIAPADGKVVVIEKTTETEFFKGDQRIQISIFMSPLNVHVNRNPVTGLVKYFKYHPGKYLVAWHPKSSELNERTTIVVENEQFGEILYRQIAGAVARRIVNYAKVGDTAVISVPNGTIELEIISISRN